MPHIFECHEEGCLATLQLPEASSARFRPGREAMRIGWSWWDGLTYCPVHRQPRPEAL